MSMKIDGGATSGGGAGGSSSGSIDGMGLDEDVHVARAYIKPGICRSSDNTEDIEVVSKLTVDMTVTGAGGLRSGLTEAADTWYAVHAIGGGGNPVVGFFDTSYTAPVLPGTYTVFRFQGWKRNDASQNFLDQTTEGTGRHRVVTYNEGTVARLIITGTLNSTVYADINASHIFPPGTASGTIGILLTITSTTHTGFMKKNGTSATVTEILSHPAAVLTNTNDGIRTITMDSGQIFEYKMNNTGSRFTQVDALNYAMEL